MYYYHETNHLTFSEEKGARALSFGASKTRTQTHTTPCSICLFHVDMASPSEFLRSFRLNSLVRFFAARVPVRA